MAYHGFKPAEQAIQIGDDEILSSHISDGVIVNADVNASAAIATSKVSGAVTSIGSHGLGSLATLSAVASAQITDGTIVNADVNNSAAIATSKLSGSLTSVGSHGLATSATTDTTNASNISSGTLAAARVATLNQNTTGQAGTVATITGLAPDTATTQATQASITSAANLATVGTITSGVWNAGALTTSGDVILTGGGSIYSDSSDNNDDDIISISGGGAVSDTRGGRIDLRGNEAGGGLGGTVRLIAGNTAEGDISFYTAGAVNMTIENGGNVGIGTTSPDYLLHLVNNTSGAVNLLDISGNDSSGDGGSGIILSDNNTGKWTIFQRNQSPAYALHFATGEGGTVANAKMTIQTDGNVGIGDTDPKVNLSVKGDGEGNPVTSGTTQTYGSGRFWYGGACLDIGHYGNGTAWIVNSNPTDLSIDRNLSLLPNGGNVGIGTTSPVAQLDVQETGITVTDNQAFVANFIGNGYTTGQVFVGDAATIAADIGGEIQFGGKYSSNSLTEWASIGGYKENSTSGQYGGYVAIKTRAHGGDLSEKMTIDSAGQLNVWGTAFTQGRHNFSSNNVNYGIADTTSGTNGTATLYIGNQSITTSSDIRIKENIVDTDVDAIAKINDLRVVDFTWDDPSDTSFNNRNARGKWTGLIAQEVIDHIPYVVNAVRDEDTLEPIADSTNEDGTDILWGMEYDKLVPVLIKAVQELSAKVEALENA